MSVPVLPRGVEMALYAARCGWSVFPVTEGNTPFATEATALALGIDATGPGGLYHGRRDEPSVQALWSGNRANARIGLCTGGRRLVIDVDEKDGKSGSATIAANGWAIPPTASQATPSGGAHYVLSLPEGATAPTDAGTLGHGLDRRGDGGYICLYDPEMLRAQIAPAPEWALWNARSPADRDDRIAPGHGRKAPSYQVALDVLRSRAPDDMDRNEWLLFSGAFFAATVDLEGADNALSDWQAWNVDYGPANNPQANAATWRDFQRSGSRGDFGTLVEMGHDRLAFAQHHLGGRQIALPPGAPPWQPAEAILSSLANVLSAARKDSWLIRRVIPREAVGLIFGQPGTGKTFLAVEIAMRVATGTPFNDHRVSPGPVIYVAGEGHGAMRDRFAAWLKDNDCADPGNIRISRKAVSFTDQAEFQALEKEIASANPKPSLIVIDTLFRATAGADVNDAREMTTFWHKVEQLKLHFQCNVMIVHHSGRLEQSRSFGSIVLLANADYEIAISRDGDVSYVENTKQKDGQPFKRFGYRLKDVPLGLHKYDDGEFETISSCVCEFVEDNRLIGRDTATKSAVDQMAPVGPSAASQRKVGGMIARLYDEKLAVKGIAKSDTIIADFAIPNSLMREVILKQGDRNEYRNGINGLSNTKQRRTKIQWITAIGDAVLPTASLLRWARDENYSDWDFDLSNDPDIKIWTDQ
jgi:hypothetical protein